MKVKELKLEDVEVPPSWGHRQKHRQCIFKELAWFAYKVSGVICLSALLVYLGVDSL